MKILEEHPWCQEWKDNFLIIEHFKFTAKICFLDSCHYGQCHIRNSYDQFYNFTIWEELEDLAEQKWQNLTIKSNIMSSR